MSDLRTPPAGGQPLHGTVAVSHHARGLAVVSVRGEHDLSTAPELTRALAQAAAHSNVVVDLSECTFIDSSVIKALITTAHALHAKGEQLALVIPAEPSQVARVVQMTHLGALLPIHSDLAAALTSLSGYGANATRSGTMNDSDRTNWLNGSAPLPIDGEEPQAPTDQHTTRVRDLRHRFGDPDHYAALCSCGWSGEPRTGIDGDRLARRDARQHEDRQRRALDGR